ncbi:glycosyltransferase [Nocardioides sp.]|uniref:glycosyltransferase n=1 Tax=Nocardioides sp. TaxID=35761 RepID=UPI00351F3953
MKILHYYAQALTHESGVTAAISLWADHQVDHGHEVRIAAGSGQIRSSVYNVPVVRVRHIGRGRSTYVPSVWKLAKLMRWADIVVLHEGWTASHYVAAGLGLLTRRRYVAMPHGVYEPGVMAGLRGPRLIRRAFERLFLSCAWRVHVYFDGETNLVSHLSGRAVCMVAPTGFDPVEIRPTAPGAFDARTPNSVELPYVFWFGRIDPHHKGLDVLLRGLALVPEGVRPRLRLAGYDYGNGRATVAELISELELTEFVELGEPVFGDEKVAAIRGSLAYVHPSRWECHSIAFLEAMALDTPVYIGAGCQISRLAHNTGAATMVNSEPTAWSRVLREMSEGDRTVPSRDEFWKQFEWTHVLSVTDSEYFGR